MAGAAFKLASYNDMGARERFSAAAKRRAYALVMPNVRSDTDPYVPYRTGELDSSVDPSQFENGVITWRAKYAGYVYYMKGAVNWTRTRHPMAGAQWAERSAAVNHERWRKMIAVSYGSK